MLPKTIQNPKRQKMIKPLMQGAKTVPQINSHEQFLFPLLVHFPKLIQLHYFFGEKIVLQLISSHRILQREKKTTLQTRTDTNVHAKQYQKTNPFLSFNPSPCPKAVAKQTFFLQHVPALMMS